MKRIACRHCREPFGIPAGFIGDARCPNCSRSTPWPPEEPSPELPPPNSDFDQSNDEAGAMLGFGIRAVVGFCAVAAAVAAWLQVWSLIVNNKPSDSAVGVLLATLPVVAIFVYLFPTYVAVRRGHPNALPIFIINLFLGVSIVGWASSLAWACIALDRRASGT